MLPDRFETARLILRPIAPEDAPAIFAGYAQDPEVVRFVTWRAHRTLADTEAFIARCLAMLPDDGRNYVLTRRTDAALLGDFGLLRPRPHRLYCGYVLARPHWGQGLMSEALLAIADWAMASPEIWRIDAVCDVENHASARVMEKAGMQREGILRRWLVNPNLSAEPRDCFSYARVR